MLSKGNLNKPWMNWIGIVLIIVILVNGLVNENFGNILNKILGLLCLLNFIRILYINDKL